MEKKQQNVKVNYRKVFATILNLFNRKGWLVPKVTEKFTEDNFRQLLKGVHFVGDSSHIQEFKMIKRSRYREVEND